MSVQDLKLVLDHIPNSFRRQLNESTSTRPHIPLEVDMRKEYQVLGHWNVVHNLIGGMTMMLFGHLPLAMGHCDLSHLPFELEQLLDAMGKGRMHARVCSGSGVEALLPSLVGARVEVEV